MTKLSLFSNLKEVVWFFMIFLVLLFGNLYLNYQNFQEMKEENFYRGEFKVLNHYHKYTKHHKKYSVLKLRHKNFTFYTTSWLKLPNLTEKKIALLINTEKITFLDFMMGFYTFSFDLEIIERTNFKISMINYISKFHDDKLSKELFLAIFLAVPPSIELREKVIFLGIAHLIALSGFHLGLLFLILFFLLKIPYQFFQNRFFPYRSSKFDLTILIFTILFFYLLFTNSPPSLVRAFVMMILIFSLYFRNYQLLSFRILFFAILIIIALLPKLFFSIGFWFSVSGVFYIYLFLHHFKHLNKILIFILIHFWVYLFMIPITHIIFVDFTFYQLLSPILSMLFIPFYPLEIFLHTIGFANLLDPLLITLFSLSPQIYHIQTSYEFLLFYFIISLLAIRYKPFLYLLFLILISFIFIGDFKIDFFQQI